MQAPPSANTFLRGGSPVPTEEDLVRKRGRPRVDHPPKHVYCQYCLRIRREGFEVTFRGYTKEWICYECRNLDAHRVITMSYAGKKYRLSKTILLAAYMLSKNPQTDFSKWDFDREPDVRRQFTQMKLRNYTGPFHILTLPNPYRNSPEAVAEAQKQWDERQKTPNHGSLPRPRMGNIPPMKLVMESQVKALAIFLFGEAHVNELIKNPPPEVELANIDRREYIDDLQRNGVNKRQRQ